MPTAKAVFRFSIIFYYVFAIIASMTAICCKMKKNESHSNASRPQFTRRKSISSSKLRKAKNIKKSLGENEQLD